MVDAGIEMLDLVSACSVGVFDNEFILNVSSEQESRANGVVFISTMNSINQITHVLQVNSLVLSLKTLLPL